jgi:small-conductance mechanosensitive channel
MQTQELQSGVQHLFTRTLFSIASTPISVATLITFALIIAASVVVSRLVQRALARTFRMRGVTHAGTVAITRRLTNYTVMIIGTGVALDTVGVNLNALFAAGAVFAVAIGFAMQNVAQNFVAGVMLLVERSIKPGDILEVQGDVVRVERMGLRATIARSREEEELIVPNGILVQSVVKNFTLRDSLYRVRARVGVAYESDLQQVREVLTRAAGGLAGRESSPAPRVLLAEFGNSSVNYDVSVWINDPWSAPVRRSELNEAIWWGLKEAGITISFPQLDVHFDRPVEERLSVSAGGR